MIIQSLQPFARHGNEIRIYLTLEQWPPDVPLPPNTALVGIGENHETLAKPSWDITLEPARTVEVVGGWFRSPMNLAETREWYVNALMQQGWILQAEPDLGDKIKIYLDFVRPAKNLHLWLSLQWWETLNETTALISRSAIHPYAAPDETNGEPAAAQIALPIAEMAEA